VAASPQPPSETVSLDNAPLPSPLPAFFWSSSGYFPSKNQQYLETLNEKDIESILTTLLGLPSNSNSKTLSIIRGVRDETNVPEVFLFFIQPKLRTEEMSQLSYVDNNEEIPFSNLNTRMTGLSTGLVMPYVYLSDGSTISGSIINAATLLLKFSPSSQIFQINSSPLFRSLPSSTLMTLNTFLNRKETDIFHNGVTDLVIVNFGDKTSAQKKLQYASDDMVVGQLHDKVNEETDGNFIACFSANMPSASPFHKVFYETEIERMWKTYDKRSNIEKSLPNSESTHEEMIKTYYLAMNSSDAIYPTYFPPVMVEVILVILVLMIILCAGLCCLTDLQTPQRFEVSKQKKLE